jgi:hypothetical protein
MKLDEFLESQNSASDAGFTAVIEAIPDRPEDVKVTPFVDEHGCGCDSSLELPKTMIESVTPTGKFHLCCGKRLEVVVVEFTENAAIPVADLMRRAVRPHEAGHAPPHYPASYGLPPYPAAAGRARGPHGIVGRFPIPGTPCSVVCIEVCTEFCSPTGWNCCRWETRCGISCGGTGSMF